MLLFSLPFQHPDYAPSGAVRVNAVESPHEHSQCRFNGDKLAASGEINRMIAAAINVNPRCFWHGSEPHFSLVSDSRDGNNWDNDTHLWFKRAKSSEVLLGDANYHRELMLQKWAA